MHSTAVTNMQLQLPYVLVALGQMSFIYHGGTMCEFMHFSNT